MTSSKTPCFWTHYEELVAELFPRLTPVDGLPAEQVAAAIARLELPLPAVLREFYLRCGARGDLQRSHERLLAPQHLRLDDEMLVFVEENQEASLWGIPLQSLQDDDPPIYRRDSTARARWTPDHDRLSEFVITLALWQAVNGGAPAGGNASTNDSILTRLASWRELPQLGQGWQDARFFARPKQLVCLVGTGTGSLLAAAHDEDQFANLDDALALEWDYIWPEDC